MKSTQLTIFASLLLVLMAVTGCKKDNPTPSEPIPAADEINTFIWSNMQAYYLWTDKVPNLTNPQFAKEDSLNAFLNKYEDHEELFDALLYKTLDHWSWIVDDYVALENMFQGITKSAGFEFGFGSFTDKAPYFGVIKYVIKGSPADLAGLKRGDIFVQIDGQNITDANYYDLLFSRDSYQMQLGTLGNNTVVPNGTVKSITKTVVQENPIYLDSIYTVNNTKIGYLVYNGFMDNFDIQLNNTFKKFKDGNISKLIIDLRYNGGGSVQTAVYLASMIYKTTTDVFVKTQYNAAVQAYLKKEYGDSYFSETFSSKIVKGTDSNPIEVAINSLNGAASLYVITTGSTASASELLINGLRPYMTVKTIGTNTAGKYVGSFTIKDYIDNKGTVNPKHKWALQPITFKYSNANNASDFIGGLAPTFELKESIYNFMPFGDINEPFLKAAMNMALGLPQTKQILKSTEKGLCKVIHSKDLIPHSREMFVKPPQLKK